MLAEEARPRPDAVVVLLGTGTGVGKTWVAARLVTVLRRRGVAVAARKPAQSYAPGDDPDARDAAVLARASGEPVETVCPRHRWYPIEMAPPMAAAALGQPPFSLADLEAELAWPVGPAQNASAPGAAGGEIGDRRATVGVVETAGGVRSPQADDADAVDLVGRLDPELLVVVADAGLGTINAVRMTVDALGSVEKSPGERSAVERSAGERSDGVVVVLNRFDPRSDLHRRNRSWLVGVLACPVLVTPGGEEELADRVLQLLGDHAGDRAGDGAATRPSLPTGSSEG